MAVDILTILFYTIGDAAGGGIVDAAVRLRPSVRHIGGFSRTLNGV